MKINHILALRRTSLWQTWKRSEQCRGINCWTSAYTLSLHVSSALKLKHWRQFSFLLPLFKLCVLHNTSLIWFHTSFLAPDSVSKPTVSHSLHLIMWHKSSLLMSRESFYNAPFNQKSVYDTLWVWVFVYFCSFYSWIAWETFKACLCLWTDFILVLRNSFFHSSERVKNKSIVWWSQHCRAFCFTSDCPANHLLTGLAATFMSLCVLSWFTLTAWPFLITFPLVEFKGLFDTVLILQWLKYNLKPNYRPFVLI